MAVKDVFRPGATNPSDPKKPNDKEDKSEWEKKAKDAKAEREYLEEQKRIDRMSQPEQPPQQPAFEVTGKAHFDIDPQRDVERERQEREAQQGKDNEKIETLTSELDKTKDEFRQSQISAAMEKMSGQFTAALKEMNSKIADVKGGADPSMLVTQFDTLVKIAEKMGFQKGTPQIGDPQIQLEITKLQMENARADREFQARLAQESRQWDLEKLKLEDDRSFKRAQIDQEAKKNEMFAKAPQVIGGAIAQGLMANQGGVSREAPPRPSRKGGKQHHVEAGWDEAGEIECPSCKQPVAIGPTAREAVCASCGERVPIKRIGEKPKGEEEE